MHGKSAFLLLKRTRAAHTGPSHLFVALAE
jgi:hypothetical protein